MSGPALVWLGIGLGTSCLLLIVLAALVRQAMLVARAAARLAREVDEVSSATERVRGGGTARR